MRQKCFWLGQIRYPFLFITESIPHSGIKSQEKTDISVLFVRPALYSKGNRNASPRKTMAKIHILGGSGSGKTTLARNLSSLLHIPHYDLDEIGLKNGFVTEDDAFALAGQPEWISEGCYLIWTEPLLSQADAILLLKVSWPVAAWRIIRRHITKSLHGTNPYPGVN